MLERMLKDLIDEIGVEKGLVKDKKGFFIFCLNDEIEIKLQDLNPGVEIYAEVGECPLKGREDLFMYLMKANLLGQGTGGARFGITQNEKILTLSISLPYEIKYDHLKEVLESFANHLISWRNELTKERY
jgi:hypothetical protein